MKKGEKMINVLSVFDGLGGAACALRNLGIACNYYASEVDKYAIQIAKKNHPGIVHLGEVRGVGRGSFIQSCKNGHTEKEYKVDLLIGGSPCQDLSSAGNEKGLHGSRSGLAWEFIRLLIYMKPRYFVLENVYSMKKDSKNIISKMLGVEPIVINSSALTAQNRKRFYWTNIPEIKQPEDKGILLKDILLSDFEGLKVRARGFNKGGFKIAPEKSPTLTSSSFENNCKVVMKGAAMQTYPRKPTGKKREKRLEIRKDYKSNAVLTNPGLIFIGGIGKKRFEDGKTLSRNYRQGSRIYSPEGKSITLSCSDGGLGASTGLYLDKDVVRKLHPIECERLQGLPDNYTEGVSNTQRYKMIGNGFTVPVIEHILSHAKF